MWISHTKPTLLQQPLLIGWPLMTCHLSLRSRPPVQLRKAPPRQRQCSPGRIRCRLPQVRGAAAHILMQDHSSSSQGYPEQSSSSSRNEVGHGSSPQQQPPREERRGGSARVCVGNSHSCLFPPLWSRWREFLFMRKICCCSSFAHPACNQCSLCIE